MRKTLLQLTQDILSGLDGDEVNSITDTTESLQVAKCLETTYWDIVSKAEFPKNFTFFELEASGDVNKPTLMFMPETQLTLQWVRYDNASVESPSANFLDVPYLNLDEFLQRMYSINSEDTNTLEFEHILDNGSTQTFIARNDRFPSCYTTFDDRTLIFDSYDAALDATLQESKTMAYGERLTTWTNTDNFIPDLPAKQFTLLLNEASSLAWAQLKQAQNAVTERRGRKAWVRSQKDKRNVNHPRNEFDRLPNYGRK